MEFDERQVASLVERVVKELVHSGSGADGSPTSPAAKPAGGIGVFETAEECVTAAERAYAELRAGGLAMRRALVAAIRATAVKNAELWGQMARDETGMGRASHKKLKNLAVANGSPGVEDLERRYIKGDEGMHLIEGVPWGVICSITPSTNPTATPINNAITMISAGNAVVFCPHPSAKRATMATITGLNAAIVAAGGPRNLLCCAADPTLKVAAQVMNHERIRIIAATGGPGVVRAAFDTKKKVFAAGPGNPPVLVDATADIDRAGEMTVKGGSFDNNLPCVAEKVAIAEARILDDYVAALVRHGAHLLNPSDIERILPVVLDGDHPRRESIGQDAAELLKRAGIAFRGDPSLVIAVLPEEHPMVIHEQMMPFLPIVRVRDFEDGLRLAVKVEHGYRHTAMLHSRDTDHITRFTDAIGTTITVINGPSYAFSGDLGEGYATMTVTTPTGEGVTSPRTWQRKRHLVYSGFLNT
jgi:propionaldehyde dehydrogenase